MCPKATDVRVRAVRLYFLPIATRVPLKFGPETLTTVTCARARVCVEDGRGRSAEGWGEVPLSVQWVWPSPLPLEPRHQTLRRFVCRLAEAWARFGSAGHPVELGHDFIEGPLRALHAGFKAGPEAAPEPMPWLAALVCDSVFDQAIHDAYGNLHARPTYALYGRDWLSRDLGDFLEPAEDSRVRFAGRRPDEFLRAVPDLHPWAWHLVGGLDPITPADLNGSEPSDGYPVLLEDWIRHDDLKCLKVKLGGRDAEWDYQRLVQVGAVAAGEDVRWLSADFNCTVRDPEYVNAVLDRLRDEQARLYGMLLYVEQPFPYDLEEHRLDVRSVSARKPLFLDESAHDWRLVRLGRSLGWSGVALKTCKTQTGAILSACWGAAHGMPLMVQDLSNPMLAQIAHVLLAAHVATIMGVETNGMQFYPDASLPETSVHPGIYRRRGGRLDLTTVGATGFGYRLAEIPRVLPAPAGEW